MRLKRLIPLAFCVLSTVTPGHAQPLKEFRSEAGGFTVLMAGSPTLQKKSIATPKGPMEAHTYVSATPPFGYLASYSDLPTGLGVGDPNMFILGLQSGFVRGSKGKLVSAGKAELGGISGRQFCVELPNGVAMTTRAAVINNRLYQLVAVTPKDQADLPEVGKFLGSFKLLRK